MPADPESTGWMATILGAAGLGGGGGGLIKLFAAQASEKARREGLEKRVDKHSESIDGLTEQATRVETTLTNFGEDIHEMKGGIKKIVDHITGTDLG